jgi:hypothetical protein
VALTLDITGHIVGTSHYTDAAGKTVGTSYSRYCWKTVVPLTPGTDCITIRYRPRSVESTHRYW